MEIEALDRCEAFRQLTTAERDVMRSLAQEIECATGETIIEDGSPANGFYVLISGQAEVTKQGSAIAQAGPGAILGEMALFNENVRTSGVRAIEACRLLFVPTTDFIRLVLEEEPAALKVMECLGQLMVQRLQQRDADLLRW